MRVALFTTFLVEAEIVKLSGYCLSMGLVVETTMGFFTVNEKDIGRHSRAPMPSASFSTRQCSQGGAGDVLPAGFGS